MPLESESNPTLLETGGLLLTAFKASFKADSSAVRIKVLSGSLVLIFNE